MRGRIAVLLALWGCSGTDGTDEEDTDTEVADTDTDTDTDTPDTDTTDTEPQREVLDDDGIIIIGAGMAGLSFAQLAHRAGRDVVVVEARGRVGGRVWTADVDGSYVDLGAGWLRGTRGNPLKALMLIEGIDTREDDNGPGALWDAELGRPELSTLGTVDFHIGRFKSNIGSLRTALGPTASALDAIDRYITDAALVPGVARAVRFGLLQFVEVDYGAPADMTSLKFLGEDERFEGGRHLVEGGMGSIIEALATDLDVRTNQVVTGVTWSEAGVVVRAGNTTYEADYALVTVPLGVLQAGSIDFDPVLPAEKTAAIGRMGMGDGERVVLQFNTQFWPSDTFLVHVSEPIGAFPFFHDLSAETGKPTLVVEQGATAALARRSATDQERVDEALEAVGNVLDISPPTPTATALSHWGSDPFSLGGVSYPKLGSTPDDRRALAAPAGTRLLFAGEATSVEYYGTVHGAMISGIREAERLGLDANLLLPSP